MFAQHVWPHLSLWQRVLLRSCCKELRRWVDSLLLPGELQCYVYADGWGGQSAAEMYVGERSHNVSTICSLLQQLQHPALAVKLVMARHRDKAVSSTAALVSRTLQQLATAGGSKLQKLTIVMHSCVVWEPGFAEVLGTSLPGLKVRVRPFVILVTRLHIVKWTVFAHLRHSAAYTQGVHHAQHLSRTHLHITAYTPHLCSVISSQELSLCARLPPVLACAA